MDTQPSGGRQVSILFLKLNCVPRGGGEVLPLKAQQILRVTPGARTDAAVEVVAAIHILLRPDGDGDGWYGLSADGKLATPHWTFAAGDLMRFP